MNEKHVELLAEALHDADTLHADDGGDNPEFSDCPELVEHREFAADIAAAEPFRRLLDGVREEERAGIDARRDADIQRADARAIERLLDGPFGMRRQVINPPEANEEAGDYIEDDPAAWASWLATFRRYAGEFGALTEHLGDEAGAASIVAGTMLSFLADQHGLYLTRRHPRPRSRRTK